MVEVITRPGGGHKMGHARDIFGVVPSNDLGDGVGTGDEIKLDVVGIELAKAPERVRSVGHALAVDLEPRSQEVRVVRSGKKRHGKAILA